jgi:hypothetical protein
MENWKERLKAIHAIREEEHSADCKRRSQNGSVGFALFCCALWYGRRERSIV